MPEKTRSLPPFVKLIGLTLVRQSPDHTETCLLMRPDLQNNKGNLHGGLIATILDTSLGLAARSDLDGRTSSATISLSVQYLAPARTDVRCITRRVRRGGSICFVEGRVIDAHENLVATGTGVFRLFEPAQPASED